MQSVRHHLNLVVRLCLALMLFSQFAVAAQACSALQGTPMSAFAQPVHHHCHDDQDSTNRNACLMHCLQGDQVTASAVTAPVAQFAAVPVGLPVSVQASVWQPHQPPPPVLAVDSGPPIPIRYCRFLN